MNVKKPENILMLIAGAALAVGIVPIILRVL
jgi:hypothetical protein